MKCRFHLGGAPRQQHLILILYERSNINRRGVYWLVVPGTTSKNSLSRPIIFTCHGVRTTTLSDFLGWSYWT